MKIDTAVLVLLCGVAFAATLPARAASAATTSFHFQKIPVRSALQVIAEEGGFNLVVSDSVTGTITLDLEDVTVEQALAVVLRLKGLGMRIEGDTLSVGASGR